MERGIAVLGAGNIGVAIARGAVHRDWITADRVHLTKRHTDGLEELAELGFQVGTENEAAITEIVMRFAEAMNEFGADLDLGAVRAHVAASYQPAMAAE